MKALYAKILLFLILLSCVAGQGPNPILTPSRPGAKDSVPAGTTYGINWTPTAGDVIRISIRNYAVDMSVAEFASIFGTGNSCSGTTRCAYIVQTWNNSGSYAWNVPVKSPPSESYILEIDVTSPSSTYPISQSGYFSITNDNFVMTSFMTNPSASVATTPPASPLPTSTESSSVTTDDSGLSRGAIIGLVIGLVTAIVAVLALVIAFRTHKGGAKLLQVVTAAVTSYMGSLRSSTREEAGTNDSGTGTDSST